jgi:hypothetical protein
MRKRLSRRACCAIAFERVEAADPPMLEAVKEALVHLDASPGLGSGRSPRCVITAAPHNTVGSDEQMFGEE